MTNELKLEMLKIAFEIAKASNTLTSEYVTKVYVEIAKVLG